MPIIVTLLLALHTLTNIPLFPNFNNLLLTVLAVDGGWGLLAGMIGAPKGRESVGVIVGFLFGALGVLFTLAMQGDRKECMYCYSLMRAPATLCPFCGEPQPESHHVNKSGRR